MRRRWSRALRWAGTATLVAAGFVLFVLGADNTPQPYCDLFFASAWPTWLMAASWPMWRAPDRRLPALLRLRSRHRRIGWRLSVLLLCGACGALVGAAVWEWCDLWHLGDGQTGAWVGCSDRSQQWLDAAQKLALLSPLPGLAEPFVWLLWPRTLRAEMRRTSIRKRIGDALADPRRWGSIEATVAAIRDFDPTRGAHGLPQPVREEPAPAVPGRPVALRSCGVSPLRGRALQQVQDQRETPVVWDGQALLVTTRGGDRVRVPLSDVPQDAPPSAAATDVPADGIRALTTLAERPAVLALVCERGTWDRLLLLDTDGFALLRFRSRRMDAPGLAQVAAAAGLPFAHYDLGRSGGDGGRVRLADLLFPDRHASWRLNDE